MCSFFYDSEEGLRICFNDSIKNILQNNDISMFDFDKLLDYCIEEEGIHCDISHVTGYEPECRITHDYEKRETFLNFIVFENFNGNEIAIKGIADNFLEKLKNMCENFKNNSLLDCIF